MSLVELPGIDGKLIAVNPHRVTGVQHHEGYRIGSPQKEDLSAIWVDNHNVYLCAWDVDTALKVLNEAKQTEAQLFAAGFRAAFDPSYDSPSPQEMADMMRAAFLLYLDGDGEPDDAV